MYSKGDEDRTVLYLRSGEAGRHDGRSMGGMKSEAEIQ